MISKKDKYIVGVLCEDMIPSIRRGSKAWEMIVAVENGLSDETWDLGKMHRWIGYAQCLMVAEGSETLDGIMIKTRRVIDAADEKFKQ